MKELEHSLEAAKVKLEDSGIALQSSEKRNEQLAQAKNAIEKRLLDATAQMQLCKDNLDRKQTEFLQSQKARDELLREKEKALENVEAGAKEQRLHCDQLAKKLSLAEKDKAELVGKCDEVQARCVELERKLQQRQLATADMQKDIDRLETALSLEKRSSSSLADVQETKEKLKLQLSVAKKDAADQKDLLWKAESDAKQLKQQAENDAKQLRKQISDKTDRIEELEKQLSSVTTSLRQQTDKIQALQKEGDAGKSELKNLQQKLTTADASLCEASSKVRTLESQVAELKKQLGAARKSQQTIKIQTPQKEGDAGKPHHPKSPSTVQTSPAKAAPAAKPEQEAKDKNARASAQSSPPATVGLGIRITEQQPHRITEVVDGGSGQGKLRVGDVLLRIDGKDTKRLTFKQVKSMLLGPPNSTVAVTVERRRETGEKQVVTLEIVRTEIGVSRHSGILARPLSETINSQLSLMQSVSGVDLSSFKTTGLFK